MFHLVFTCSHTKQLDDNLNETIENSWRYLLYFDIFPPKHTLDYILFTEGAKQEAQFGADPCTV